MSGVESLAEERIIFINHFGTGPRHIESLIRASGRRYWQVWASGRVARHVEGSAQITSLDLKRGASVGHAPFARCCETGTQGTSAVRCALLCGMHKIKLLLGGQIPSFAAQVGAYGLALGFSTSFTFFLSIRWPVVLHYTSEISPFCSSALSAPASDSARCNS